MHREVSCHDHLGRYDGRIETSMTLLLFFIIVILLLLLLLLLLELNGQECYMAVTMNCCSGSLLPVNYWSFTIKLQHILQCLLSAINLTSFITTVTVSVHVDDKFQMQSTGLAERGQCCRCKRHGGSHLSMTHL